MGRNQGKVDAVGLRELAVGCHKRRFCQDRLPKNAGASEADTNNCHVSISHPGVEEVYHSIVRLEEEGNGGTPLIRTEIRTKGVPQVHSEKGENDADWAEQFVNELDSTALEEYARKTS